MARNSSILIVTESDDHHVRIISEALAQRNVSVFRLDVDTFLDEQDAHPFVWSIMGGVAAVHGTQLPCDVTTVWYRRRNPFHDAKDSVESFVWQEREGIVESILNTYESCRWVNRRSSLVRARPKLSQLVKARQQGLRIPKTIVTNSLDELSSFADACDGDIVAKPIQTQVLHDGTEHLVLGTRTLHKNDFNAAISHMPCYAQEKLPVRSELRVVVFGEHMYAFRQTRKSDADDIKQLSLDQIRHEYCTLDECIATKLQALMRHYELEFAAIDLVEVDSGDLVFLEINPNGQWLWLQYATGTDLATPFVRFLCE